MSIHYTLKLFSNNNLKTQFFELYTLGYLVMRNQNFSHHSLLALPFYMHYTKDFHNFSLKIPQISLASTQQIQILLPHRKPLLQISYVIPSESVFPFECFEQSSSNSTNTPILELKSHTIQFPIIITFHFLKNGSQFSYITV